MPPRLGHKKSRRVISCGNSAESRYPLLYLHAVVYLMMPCSAMKTNCTPRMRDTGPALRRNHPPRSIAILSQVYQRLGTYRADYMAYRSGTNALSLNMHLSDFTAY
ncbi:hypothetical protein FCULG_00012872 [Fusarium culmorum]|uniref:Uncharacterized protein n=1 Tax=Fusarium culmorum TaxID=5516 RepID=A0A2T4GG11_FUSCU|nr:hypothetical protein FCULG_00012872 [Fusarium culmorum]